VSNFNRPPNEERRHQSWLRQEFADAFEVSAFNRHSGLGSFFLVDATKDLIVIALHQCAFESPDVFAARRDRQHLIHAALA